MTPIKQIIQSLRRDARYLELCLPMKPETNLDYAADLVKSLGASVKNLQATQDELLAKVSTAEASIKDLATRLAELAYKTRSPEDLMVAWRALGIPDPSPSDAPK